MLALSARHISTSNIQMKLLPKPHFVEAPCSCEPSRRADLVEEVAEYGIAYHERRLLTMMGKLAPFKTLVFIVVFLVDQENHLLHGDFNVSKANDDLPRTFVKR